MKNQKVKFENAGKIAFIIGGIIILIIALLFSYFLLPLMKEKDTIVYIEYLFFAAGMFIIGILYLIKPFIPSKNGLTSMEIKDSELYITMYDNTKNKNDIRIPLHEIQSAEVDISDENVYDIKSFQNNLTINTIYCFSEYEKNLYVKVTLTCKNDKIHNLIYSVQDLNKIKQLFSIIKYLPNFTYNVNVKLGTSEAYIHKYAKSGKGLNLVELLKTLLIGKGHDGLEKIEIRCLLCILIFLIFILIIMIASIIKDVLSWN